MRILYNMKNRLQFLHCNKNFETAQEAKNYMENRIVVKGFRPLYGEPMVFRYGEDKKILLGICSNGSGDPFDASATVEYFDSGEIDGFRKEIEDMQKKIRIPETAIIDGVVKENIIKSTEDGLFSFVDVSYDDENSRIVLQVNDKIKYINIPEEKYLVSGSYDDALEKIVLTMNNGENISIDVKKLIDEWTVLNNEDSPIILTKTRNIDGKDTLSADVQVDMSNPYNILEKQGGKLRVLGTADNIKVITEGEIESLQDTINDMKRDIKESKSIVSQDSQNIIYNKADGLFASVDLDYDQTTNTLTFIKSNDDTIHRFKLNSIQFLDDITYDQTTETLVIRYTDAEGNTQRLEIPIKDMFEEWEVDNTNTTVTLNKDRVIDGKTRLTANVNVSNSPDNILQVTNHELYVKGTSDNIKYNGTTTVEQKLNELSNKDNELDSNLVNLSSQIQTEVSDRQHQDELLSTNLNNRIDGVEDSINDLTDDIAGLASKVITTDDTPTVDLNLADYRSEEGKLLTANVKISQANNNLIITNNEEGLYAYVDMNIDGDTLKLTGSNGFEKSVTLPTFGGLQSIDIVDRDNSKFLVIHYIDTITGELKEVAVNLNGLIDAWDVDNFNCRGIALEKTLGTNGEPDKLSAKVLVSENVNHNILEFSRPTDGSSTASLFVRGESDNIYYRNSDPDVQLDAENVQAALDYAIHNVGDVNRISGYVDEVKAELDNTQMNIGLDEDGNYIPDLSDSILSGASSFTQADSILSEKLKDLSLFAVPKDTATINSEIVESGITLNAKLSGVQEASQGDLTINEEDERLLFGNAIRIVDMGTEDDPRNGLYLSSSWDCGEY